MICQRGWYSSTDFWSPTAFDQYVVPRLKELISLTHAHGKKFAYVVTTGVELIGPKLVEAGVDVLYFIDPLMDNISIQKTKELFEGRITVIGGISSLSLAEDPALIRIKVREALEVLGPGGRFILHPICSLFPDTPWLGVETLISTWKEFR
jgi:uroporphyrinogen-III decarboxylase